MTNNSPDRKIKVGLALSGSGSRLAFYIGFLEELDRLQVPIDYIAAMSGGSVVAAAYACGTLAHFKEIAFSADRKQVMEMLPRGKGGLYSLDELEEYGRREFTLGKNFEEVIPRLSFVASDIESGEQVLLSMGDIARAVRISCTLPLFFEPVKWGGKTLIDGGLLNYIPVDVLKEVGMDITVGINMRGTKHLFTGGQLAVKKMYNTFKKLMMWNYLEKAWDLLNGDDEDDDYFDKPVPMLSALGRSMDLALAANKKDPAEKLECDLMITPPLKGFTVRKIEDQKYELYELGRKAAQENAPKIFKIIETKIKQPVV